MRTLLDAVAAAAVGAVAMYYLDPQMGRRRRALVRDQLQAGSNDAKVFLERKGKRGMDRARGMAAQAHTQFSGSSAPSSDAQLAERIRARLGRLVNYPGAIDVEAASGSVRLSGHVLSKDLDTILSEVSAIPGVEGVENMLSAYDEAGSIPELQGR